MALYLFQPELIYDCLSKIPAKHHMVHPTTSYSALKFHPNQSPKCFFLAIYQEVLHIILRLF